ncbi:F-box/LRR-repeat protein 25 [Camellia lanceoleosa]|uniref:F-box/LRR-repeat protein 25 n=1 Tax=Camellia lanceoleosa TaxID=1840588 RepID=A0ACC0HB72_9ERIC|nr:F-box/LRR-repeat protein 25 [Camellia lanceoleosa]
MFHRKKGHKQKRSSFKSRNNESTKKRKNQEQRTSEKDDIDRLSDLPEPIIHQILLCLPLADTISTKSLSRRWWQTVWPSCPILYFDEYCFRANYFQFVDDDWERREKFTRFLQRSLAKQKKCVNGYYNTDKFGLRMVSSHCYSDSIIAKWVQFALESNAKELDLRIKRVDWACFKTYNRLVDDVFVAQSITVLYLEYCNIQPSCSINLPCLKKLTLSESKIRDNVFKKLIQGCPLIEHLCVEFCKNLQHIEVSIPNLKSLKLNFSGLYKVAIASVNLSSVELSGDFDAEVDFAAFATVKDMTLKNVTITDVELEHLISWCPMLVSLVIDGCNKLERIRVCCELLKRFVMLRCRRMVEAEFDTPNLVSFEYSGDLMYFKWVNRLRSVDAKINLDPKELDADWYIGLRRFIKQLMYSKFLTLICRSDQAIIFPGELSENLLPPLPALKHLKLEIISALSTTCSTIVDGLVWIFPGLETLTIKSASTNKFIKVRKYNLLLT